MAPPAPRSAAAQARHPAGQSFKKSIVTQRRRSVLYYRVPAHATTGVARTKKGWTTNANTSIEAEHFMNDIIIFLLIIGIWILLQAVILPKMGVST
jgi:hypothetical protein